VREGEVWVVSVPHWAQRVSGTHWLDGARVGAWFLWVFVVRLRSWLHLLSVDVAKGNAVGTNQV
jgi:hypothetical protein